jgi:thiamine biosynthesis protein ThiS
MEIQLNGKTTDTEAPTLAALVEELALKPDRIAVELNGEIARRAAWPELALKPADRIEIVHFVGGGA